MDFTNQMRYWHVIRLLDLITQITVRATSYRSIGAGSLDTGLTVMMLVDRTS